MESKHRSIQIIFAIISIAILVIAVVGVSFAFFSYSKTGTTNNVIETGQIYMYFNNSSTISLSDQFPMKNNEATSGLTGENQSMTFTVTGYSSGSSSISYTVYAIKPDGATTTGRFPNDQISVFLSQASSNKGQTITSSILNTPTHVNDAVDNGTGWAIASGTIAAGTQNGSEQVDTYTLKMFVNDTVRISDTDTSVTWNGSSRTTNYCASQRVMNNNTYQSGCKIGSNGSILDNNVTGTTLPVYNTMYYSLKVKVVGTA